MIDRATAIVRHESQLLLTGAVLELVYIILAAAFRDQAPAYYNSIEGSVGRSVYCDGGTFVSTRGVYSKWFRADDLKELFERAGMADCLLLDASRLRLFESFYGYVDQSAQQRARRRALVGIASVGSVNVLDGVRELIAN